VHALVNEVAWLGIGRKILLTGPNYRATEVLADRVFNSLSSDPTATCDLFRAYSKSRPLPTPLTYPGHFGGTEVSLSPGLKGYTELQTSLLDPTRFTLVATSAHTAGAVAELVQPGILAPVFDVVIIDESSQVDVTLALQALATLKESGQVVIAGDHLQMPPIAIVDPPLNAEYLVGSIQTYLIDRFGLQPNPLTVNYRSNQTIVDYALTLGYPPALVAHEPTRRLHEVVPRASVLAQPPAGLPTSAAWEVLLDPTTPVCCLLHEDETASQANASEAKMVAALIDGLFRSMSRDLDPTTPVASHALMTDVELFARGVGVVTPHKAQRATVLTELETLFPNTNRDLMADAVDTVERFQGGERHTIIVSFGVGDIEVIQGEEEFLLQLQRINVAVSRAMAKCIVILPKSLAYHLPSERKVLKTAKAIKSYIEEFCAQRKVATIQFGSVSRGCEVRWH
jgi:superfamily I DNA and/or RNA helicase